MPDDPIPNAADKARIRQHLVLVALGKRPADSAVRLIDVNRRHRHKDQEVSIAGRRIARVGPAGRFPGHLADGCP